MFDRILVPIDGSKTSDKAVLHAIRLLAEQIMRVVSVPVLPAVGVRSCPRNSIPQSMRRQRSQKLSPFLKLRLPDSG